MLPVDRHLMPLARGCLAIILTYGFIPWYVFSVTHNTIILLIFTDPMIIYSIRQVDRAEEDGSVVFPDGSRIKADVILHCTGYGCSLSPSI
jgi:hypothetical protein